jgi:hypothetical protein
LKLGSQATKEKKSNDFRKKLFGRKHYQYFSLREIRTFSFMQHLLFSTVEQTYAPRKRRIHFRQTGNPS